MLYSSNKAIPFNHLQNNLNRPLFSPNFFKIIDAILKTCFFMKINGAALHGQVFTIGFAHGVLLLFEGNNSVF